MSATKEPCVSCGEETAAGSPLFSDRRVVDTSGGTKFVCSACMQRAAKELRRDRLTDDETRRFIDSGSMAIIGNH